MGNVYFQKENKTFEKTVLRMCLAYGVYRIHSTNGIKTVLETQENNVKRLLQKREIISVFMTLV